MFNIKTQEFNLELFWNTMEKQRQIHSIQNENYIYCFYKKGENYYIQASNEYDLMIKLKNNNILDCDVYTDLSCDTDPNKTFETIETLYNYFVDEYIRLYREVYKYYFEKLVIIY
jgi:hypothetical protein